MIELKLTKEEVNTIIQGLLELQAKYSIDLIVKIDAEAKKQIEDINKKSK